MSSLRAAFAVPMRGLLVCGLVACAGLAACSKPASRGGPSSGAPASSAPGSAVIGAAELPHPRAGQWELIDAGGAPADHSRFCVADRPINLGHMREHCQTLAIHRTPTGGVVMDAACKTGDVATKMHMEAKGDFQSAYSTDMQMTFTLHPGDTPHVSNTHMEYRYVGPCPAGQATEAEAAGAGE